MKLSDLDISNFQSWKKVILKFHEHLNVITGPSDAGKSSIIRSIKLLVTNRPAGDSYRTHGSKQTIVQSGSVARYKTKSKNHYIVGSDTFKAIRSDVPEEVQQALNLSKVNIQEQKDHFFLLNDTPGKVSSTINKVAGLDKMDASIAQINADIRKIKTNKEYKEELIAEKKKQVEDLAWVFEATILYDKIEKKQKTINNYIQQISVYGELIKQIREIRIKIKGYLSEHCVLSITKICSLSTSIDTKKDKIESIQAILSSIRATQTKIKESTVIDISSLQKLHNEITLKNKKIAKLEALLKHIKIAKESIAQTVINLEDTKKQISNFDVCPECGRVIE